MQIAQQDIVESKLEKKNHRDIIIEIEKKWFEQHRIGNIQQMARWGAYLKAGKDGITKIMDNTGQTPVRWLNYFAYEKRRLHPGFAEHPGRVLRKDK